MTLDMKERLECCLSQQISELELLQSMYSSLSDIIITDKNIIIDIQNFLVNKSDFVPNHLDYTLNISVDDLKLEVCINLPTYYPEEEPDIYVRCNQLNRKQESKLNTAITEYLKENHIEGEVCLYNVILWLQENIDNFKSNAEPDSNELIESFKVQDETFQRLWIFSHHIYNKKKREEILKRARELNLTGFCLPGKPGVVCIEGESSSCMEWWKAIKSMTWKKIVIRKTETFQLSEEKSARKFTNFIELNFINQNNSKHTNMSVFSKYMSDLGFSQVFSEFFGLGSEP